MCGRLQKVRERMLDAISYLLAKKGVSLAEEAKKKPSAFYSVIVRKDAGVWAEDADGNTIASGEAGVDDVAVIQSGINHIASLGGGILLLSANTFTFSDKVSINCDYISIIGAGRGKTVINGDPGTDKPYFELVNDTTTPRKFITIADFTIDGSDRPSTGTQFSAAIWDEGDGDISYLIIENMEIINSNPYAGCIQFENSSGSLNNVLIRNCYLETIHHSCYGLAFRKPTTYAFIINNKIIMDHSDSYNNLALYQDISHAFVAGNILISSGGHTPLAVSPGSYVNVIGNIVKASSDSGEGGIEVEWKSGHGTETSHHVNVIGNVVRNGNWGIYITRRDTSQPFPYRVNIIGNVVENCAVGVYADGGTDIIISHNNVVNNTTSMSLSGLSNAIIEGNLGYVNKNGGTATFSGDGTTTQFSIAHGLVSTPTKVQVTPLTADAAGDFYVTADATNIYINYLSPPASGVDNVQVWWEGEV
ncbi:MAG: hypothetical protein DRP09_20115 [Candidatus Thorarchaeota archaeon]|nr:MAG: hypothetical protein DRP09_20115 [Candidatus Thorarchaeota archaeon]